MTSKKRCTTSAAAIAVVFALGGSLSAQPSEPSPEDERVTRYEELTARGGELFRAGDYAGARAAWEQAYQIHDKPIHLFNIASTYRREGDDQRALDFYRQYLEVAEATDEYRPVAEDAVTTLEAQIAASDVPEKEPPPPGRALRWTGIGFGVAGALALGFGVYRGLEARDLNNFFEDLPDGTVWTPEMEEDFDRGESLEKQAVVFSIAGASAIALGGALYVAGVLGSRAEREVAVTPYTDGTGLGMAVAGSF